MQRMTELMLVACVLVVMTSLLQPTTAAPSWKPQGRFGKRGGSSGYLGIQKKPQGWRPQGRFGKRSLAPPSSSSSSSFEQSIDAELLKSAALSGAIEVPVELLSTGENGLYLSVGVKPCSITGVDGIPLCHGASEGSSETF